MELMKEIYIDPVGATKAHLATVIMSFYVQPFAGLKAFLKREFGQPDARLFQIAFLGSLLMTGVLLRDFSIHKSQIFLTFTFGIATQIFWIRRLGLKNIGLLSALVTCLGTCLLLRSDRMWVHPLAVTLAMSSKFTLRFRDKHLFNPAAFGVIFSLLFLPGTWVSAGQWGFEFAVTGWVLALGSLVVWRSKSQIISWPFLLSYAGLLLYRVEKLGYAYSVWFHQLQNGAILLFAFFMISDPKTTPNHKVARMIHAAAVAYLGFYWQFRMFKQNGLPYAIMILAPLVPLLDLFFKAKAFEWKPSVNHERHGNPGRPGSGAVVQGAA